jgi:acetyl esterase/lipase
MKNLLSPRLPALVGALTLAAAVHAETPRVIPLWPEGVPGTAATDTPEQTRNGRIFHVRVPTLTYYPARPGSACGTAVIVCPGGGYSHLATIIEGDGAKNWLHPLGVAVFVLKYRLNDYGHPAPLRDVLRAIRLVRARASEYGVDPDRIGVYGASAGGHLAASAGTLYDDPDGRTGAALDTVDARPDFLVLEYPVITMRDPYAHAGSRQALLGDHPSAALIDHLSVERHVTKATPPTFIVQTEGDRVVPYQNSLLFYEALRVAGVPVEMHLYEKGPHGFGFRTDLGPTSEWPRRAETWMRSHGWLDKPGP